jgi:hypothetical protein
VQVLYPDHAVTAGASFTTLSIKVITYKGGRAIPVWYTNNSFFTAALKDMLKKTEDVDFGSDWLNYALKFMVEVPTRDTCFGADVQKVRNERYTVTHMATYLKCGATEAETAVRVTAVAECLMTYLSESTGEGDEMYYPFEEAFRDKVSPNLLGHLQKGGFLELRGVGFEIGTTLSLDELCMDDFICDAVFYCFGLNQELLMGPREQWPKAALGFGWKKHQL